MHSRYGIEIIVSVRLFVRKTWLSAQAFTEIKIKPRLHSLCLLLEFLCSPCSLLHAQLSIYLCRLVDCISKVGVVIYQVFSPEMFEPTFTLYSRITQLRAKIFFGLLFDSTYIPQKKIFFQFISHLTTIVKFTQ